MLELKGKYNKDCKIFIDDIEPECYSLVQSILDCPASENVQVRIMPDTHVGSQIVIGFTMPLTNMIKPEWIGVDIGCSVTSAMFSTKNELDLKSIENKIRRNVPMGFDLHKSQLTLEFPFNEAQITADRFIRKYNEKFNTNYSSPTYDEKWLKNKLKEIGMDVDKFYKSIGTLGSGNHFVEVGVDQHNNHWVTVHCGSRNFGLKVAKYWSSIASGKVNKTPKEYDVEFKKIVETTLPKSEIPFKINELKKKFNLGIDREFLMGDDLVGYLFDMIFAQQYAKLNHSVILNEIGKAIGLTKFEDSFSSVHNYIDFDDLIIRKGAIRSYKNEKLIIPWNMRDGLIIGEGKSNQDWNCSAPHGAGRLFSRSKAKEILNLDEFKKTMEGIYTTSVCQNTIDESPFAYKDSELIEKLIEPTVNILHKVKPIINLKDKSSGINKRRKKQNISE